MHLEDNPYWAEKRVFSRFEALLYLISITNPKTKLVEVRPKILAAKWQWNKMRMSRFLKNLEERKIIYKTSSQKSGGVTGVLRGCYRGVTTYSMQNDCLSMTFGSLKSGGVTGVLRGCYRGVTISENFAKKDSDDDVEIIDPLSFEVVWDLYDKKTDTARSRLLWGKLSNEEKRAAIEYIPKYKEAQPNKKYRKNFTTFVNQKAWNDELIYDKTDVYAEREQRIAEIARAINANGQQQEKDIPF